MILVYRQRAAFVLCQVLYEESPAQKSCTEVLYRSPIQKSCTKVPHAPSTLPLPCMKILFSRPGTLVLNQRFNFKCTVPLPPCRSGVVVVDAKTRLKYDRFTS